MKKMFEIPAIEIVKFETEEIMSKFASHVPDDDELGGV